MIEETVGSIPSEPGNNKNSDLSLDNGWYTYTVTVIKKDGTHVEEVRYRQGQDNLPDGVSGNDLVALEDEEEIGRVGNSIFVFDPESKYLKLKNVPVRRIDFPSETKIGKHKPGKHR